jgi:hypothetical protein
MEEMPMTIRKVATGMLLLSLVVTAVPARAETPTVPSVGAASPMTMRASVDRAIAAAAIASGQPGEARAPHLASNQPSRFATASAAGQASMGGGGGGKTMMIVGILGTVAGLASTYFVIKQVKKTTDAATRAQ